MIHQLPHAGHALPAIGGHQRENVGAAAVKRKRISLLDCQQSDAAMFRATAEIQVSRPAGGQSIADRLFQRHVLICIGCTQFVMALTEPFSLSQQRLAAPIRP